MKSKVLGLLAFAFLFSISILDSAAQVELGKDKVKVTFSVQQNKCEATIIARIVMDEHWHINSTVLPEGSFGYETTYKLNKSSDFKTAGGLIEPKPHVYMDEIAGEMLSTHDGTIVMKQKIKILSDKDFTVTGVFDFQTCDEARCLPPAQYEFSVKVKACSSDEEASTEEDIEKSFTKINGDEAQNKEGVNFVKVNSDWHEVPAGNSVAFYKKYLTLVSQEDE